MSDGTWRHTTAASAGELEEAPPEVPALEAQRWCNFIIWVPSSLPEGMSVRTATLRREAPPGRPGAATAGRTPWSEANPSAYRIEVAGAGGRFRLKEFLYDWAFPALDHPALWESATRARPIKDDHVVWLGTDYLKHQAASARLGRTTTELSVLEGELSEEQVVWLYEGLRPADREAADRIAATPMAQLSYWARRQDAPPISVPIGLWRPGEDGGPRDRWVSGDEARRAVAGLGLPERLAGLEVESAGGSRDPARWRAGLEAVYSGGWLRGRELRVIARRADPQEPPPERESHPGASERADVGGRSVHLAWISEMYGPFDAVIAPAREGDLALRVLSSAGQRMTREWFTGVLRALTVAPPGR